MKVNYNIGVITGFSGNKVTKYPASAVTYPSTNNVIVGRSMIMPTWGFKVWKGNAGHDGVLRSQSDIDAYWAYLTKLASAAGDSPSYMGITSESGLSTGMLAYQDLHGAIQSNGSFAIPNGEINANEDYAKLASGYTYGFTTNLGLNWNGFSWFAQIATGWGGYASLDYIKQSTSSSNILWSHESYLSNMYDATNNVNGKYPNAYYSQNYYNSDFWQVPAFRSYIKNMGIGYTLPANLLKKFAVESATISLVGNNLWDFYNPYPDHYRNMYDNSKVSYPTLRTYSLGINLTF
ncbi:hypothetical protein [Microbacter margulisiae]|uniref:Uncharacterized protein n=1 Tax=Microbacter margulisiae TaxID=1350067 RepID=A0A7W5DQ27_9PORP|nr:hypothetical protein [Microbacter margulisiae]MBB3186985.1 hypothetical protein [Microbacter margulisiae]